MLEGTLVTGFGESDTALTIVVKYNGDAQASAHAWLSWIQWCISQEEVRTLNKKATNLFFKINKLVLKHIHTG